MLDRNQFIAQLIAQSDGNSQLLGTGMSWIETIRSDSREHLQNKGLPERSNEYWKYSSPEHYLFNEESHDNFSPDVWCSDTSLNVNMQGQLSKGYGLNSFPDGLTVIRFSEAGNNPISHAVLKQYFNRNLENLATQSRYDLSNLNTSMLNDGLLIHVREGVSVAPLLNLELHSTGYQRLLIVLEAGSSLSLLEQMPTNNHVSSGLNHIVETVLGANTSFEHSRIQPVSRSADYALTSAQLQEHARYKLNLYVLGAVNRRHDINFQLSGEDSKVDLNSAIYADNSQKIETLVNMEHIGERTVSKQVIRGIATSRARISINGRIHIHPNAQYTDASLSNKNLLLDNTARINTKPELEIYADQVKCAHGATVGQINEEEIFYLRSRGIDPDTARHMIAQGFIQSCLVASEFSEHVEKLFKEAFTSWEQ